MYKVLLWGTGRISAQCEANGINAEIIGYVETQKTKEWYREKRVYGANEIGQIVYDYLIVANDCAAEVEKTCEEYHVSMEKVIFLTYRKPFHGQVEPAVMLDILGRETFTRYMGDLIEIKHTFFAEDMEKYNQMNQRESFSIKEENLHPIITDRSNPAGALNNYMLQDLWAAKLVCRSGVKKHYDIGSRVDGFITHLLAMDIEVTLIDIREYPGKLNNLKFIQADATTMDGIEDESIESLSALCSLEHFGLGRYGDPVDPEACFKCFEAIQRKMKKGGQLYIAVPVGKERVEFNAHRIFYASTVIDSFPEMELKEFAVGLGSEIDANIKDIHKYDTYDVKGAGRFGLFYFVKK